MGLGFVLFSVPPAFHPVESKYVEASRSFNRAEWGLPRSWGASPQLSVHLLILPIFSQSSKNTMSEGRGLMQGK